MSSEALRTAYKEALDQYTKEMEQVTNPESRSMPKNRVRSLHGNALAAARATYYTKANALHANTQDIDHYLIQLTEDINHREQQYINQNEAKMEKAVEKAIDAYHNAIERVTQGKPLCLNSIDLENVHAGAVRDAQKIIRENRVGGGYPDSDATYLTDYLLSKIHEYRLLNTKNNKLIGIELAIKYFQEMVGKCTREPRLSIEALNMEHEKARVKALAEFATRRNRNKKFKEDVLKFKVEQYIMIQYSHLKQINASAGSRTSFLKSVSAYDQSLSPSVLWQYCLHPAHLKKNHDDALCRALQVFRPNRTCSEGFHDSEKEELDLHLIFENRFRALADINSIANETAEETAFLEFRFKYNKLANSGEGNWYTMSQSKRLDCYNKAIVVGLAVFHAKHRDMKQYAIDSYEDDFVKRCKKYAYLL